jgi:hypothetical protein
MGSKSVGRVDVGDFCFGVRSRKIDLGELGIVYIGWESGG